MKFKKYESGLVVAYCDCGKWYDISSEWDVANMDFHEFQCELA